MTRLEALQAELAECKAEMRKLCDRSRTYETNERNALRRRITNIQININQEKQKCSSAS